MPIDVATGILHLDYEDVSIPGKVPLVLDRHYSTALLDRAPGMFGVGWTSRYGCSLTQTDEAFEFVTPSGAIERFDDPERLVDRGGVVRKLGAFLEIFTHDHRYIVQSWDVEGGEATRYCFAPGGSDGTLWLESIESVTGQRLEIARDASGRLDTLHQRAEGRRLRLSHDPRGPVTAALLETRDGQVVLLAQYLYDARGRLVAASDASGAVDRYEYDERSRLVREVARDGGVFVYRFDRTGRCVKTWGLGRYQERTVKFMDAVRCSHVTDSYGRTTRYHFLDSGQIVRIVDPSGAMTSIEYDEHGRIAKRTGPNGSATSYAYDDFGNRFTITDAMGNVQTTLYGDQHLAVAFIDAMGATWKRAYDDQHRLAAVEDPLGGSWKLRYGADGNPVEIVDPRGASKHLTWSDGLLTEVVDWMGESTRFRYDAQGRVVRRVGPGGALAKFSYDVLGNPTELKIGTATPVRCTYDRAGNMTSFANAAGHTNRFRYGPCHRLLEQTDALGQTVRYTWGTEPGHLEAIVNQQGERCSFERDDAGRVVLERAFDGVERRFRYDAAGDVVQYVNGNGEAVGVRRDLLRRVVERVLPDGRSLKYAYDPAGRLARAEADSVIEFERDLLGRVVREHSGDTWIENRYDPFGNLIGVKTSQGHEVSYEYDLNGRCVALTAAGAGRVTFARDARGLETVRRFPGGLSLEQTYDGVGRLVGQRVRFSEHAAPAPTLPGAGTPRDIVRRGFLYDPEGGLVGITDDRWGRIDYMFDPVDRLLQVIRERGLTEFFTYDGCGNVVRGDRKGTGGGVEGREYGPGNRLLRKGAVQYKYDAEGRRIERSQAATGGKEAAWRYEWDALDRLHAVTDTAGQRWTYRYDALDRRVMKEGRGERRCYVWHGHVVVLEIDGNGESQAWAYEPTGFAPVCKIVKGGMLSVIPDHLGTPREMVDRWGHVVWQAIYSAWGEIELAAGKAADCPIRFPGQWHDVETGLHHNRFRYYDPEIGRYLSQDPLRLRAGLNHYSYTPNPVAWSDPFGLSDGAPPPSFSTDYDGNPVATFKDQPGARVEFHQSDGTLTVGYVRRGEGPAHGSDLVAAAHDAKGLPPPDTIVLKNVINEDTNKQLAAGVPPKDTLLGKMLGRIATALGMKDPKITVEDIKAQTCLVAR